jgi:hypothetical protein
VNDALATAPDASPPQSVIESASPVSRRTDALAVASLALILTILFGDVLIGANNFYMRDLTRYYYPAKQILREIVYGGEFPYWNRYFSAGQPIAANPEHEVFYPLTWLILLPSYDFGYRLLILVHLYIGLLGMYALLRSMDLRPFAAWFGAISFGLGGLYLSEVNLLPILFCAAWLPLTCLFVRRFLLFRSGRDFAIASLVMGLQFLVAEPTTVLQTGMLIGMYALYRGWYARQRLRQSITSVLGVALISITALAVGAVQIIPAIDHVRDSARSRPFEFDLVSAWSMPWAKFVELMYPNILGHISIKRVMWYWGGGLYPGMGSPFLFSIYVGLLAIALSVGAAFVRPRGGRLVLVVCLISAVLALGGHTPLLKWLYDAGIATSIRYPEKFAMMGIFALIIFAAQMLDRILVGDDALRDGALGFTFAVTAVALAFAVISFTPLYERTFLSMWGMTRNGAALHMVAISRIDWVVAFVRGALVAAILFTVRLPWRRAWIVATALVVTADLAYVTWELNPRMPRRFFDPPPVASTFPKNRADFRLFHEADWYGTSETARQFFSTGENVYWVVRNGLFPMTAAGSRLRMVIERDYDKTILLPTIALTDSVWEVKGSGRTDWWEPFMAMSNAWYRAVYNNFESEQKRIKGDFKRSFPIKFLEGTHWPRYYFADQIVSIRDRQDFVAKLKKESFSRQVAFIRGRSFVPSNGVVRRVVESANRATVDVESFGRGFLVMSVTPHKYWSITVDGLEVPPIVTNIGYQGIVVAAGRHRIVMAYENDLVKVGMWISLITIVVLISITLFYRRRERPA